MTATMPDTSPSLAKPTPATPTAAASLGAAVARLRALQDPAGWWKGELETNVTIEAEDVMLRQFLGIQDPERVAATARWIRSRQRPDGSWATFHAGPPDLSTTVEAYVALRMAGDPADAEHLRRAAHTVRRLGGVGRSRVFTRVWLALFGLADWDTVPALPPELVLLPRWFPLNIYDWACWARQTIVPLSLVVAARPVRPVPFDLAELSVPGDPRPGTRAGGPGWRLLDGLLRRYGRHPLRRVRAAAERRAVEWVVRRQEADGSWGGIQPPWVYSLIALHLLGYSLDHPVMRAGLEGLEGFTVAEPSAAGPVRRLEACQSPVWDTAFAVQALLDAGAGPDDPGVTRAVDWLLEEEISSRGDWAVRRPGLAPGGWAFEFHNEGYPDIDDTAEVVIALARTASTSAAVERGVDWVAGMRSRSGGWAAFDADNTSRLVERLPFCDFGAVIDPPSADVTAHVLEMLAVLGRAGSAPARDGVRWLLANQEPDGSWFGRWGANHVYGTWCAVTALVRADVDPCHPALQRAQRWLTGHQNPDGGWGEDLRSYRDPAWVGRGDSTASQTSWALLALLALGERSDVVDRGVAWLVHNQDADGGWDEPHYTGTGFPGDFFINYHLYRLVFPVSALGRYLGGQP